MSEKCYGRKRVHSSDGKRIADIECWELDGKVIYRTMVYNSNMFLTNCSVLENEDDAMTIAADYFYPAELVYGDMISKMRNL